MSNNQINTTLLRNVAPATKRIILQCVANECACSIEEAESELESAEAEHILDYMSGSTRAASLNVCKSQSTWKNGAHWREKSLLDAVLEAEEIRCRRDLLSPATVSDALELLEDGFTLIVE